jgi:hypothetical protein
MAELSTASMSPMASVRAASLALTLTMLLTSSVPALLEQ